MQPENNIYLTPTDLREAAIKAKQQTADNDHTGALLTIARYAAKGNENGIVMCMESIETLHSYYGEMTPYLIHIRNDLAARLMRNLDPMEKTVFHNCI